MSKLLLPMIAKELAEVPAKLIDWTTAYAQPLLSGVRCAAQLVNGRVHLTDAKGVVLAERADLYEPLKPLLRPGQMLDGVLHCPWSKLKGNFYAVDLTSTENFGCRYTDLYALLRGHDDDRVVLAKTVMVRSREELMICQKEFLDSGAIGVVLRHGRQGYTPAVSTPYLVKIDSFKTAYFKVVDARVGAGKRLGHAIFVCETSDDNYFDVPISGPDNYRRRCWDRWRDFIGKRLTVRYHEMSDGAEAVPLLPVAVYEG